MSVCAYGAPAAERAVNIKVTKYGELVYSHEGKVESLDQSLADMMQAQGYAAVRANLTVILSLITHNAYPSSELNSNALNEFFAQAGALGLGDIASSVIPSPTRKINLNLGTLEELPSFPWNVYEMRASLIWHRVPEISRKFTAGLDPLVRSLFENWLKGAKQAANEIKPEIYAQFPILQSARIVEEFQRLTVMHLVAQIFVTGGLYDFAAIVGDSGATATWTPVGVDSVGGINGTLVSPANATPSAVLAAPVKPVGASNGSAMVVRMAGAKEPVSVVFGEPHQHTSAQTESSNNIMLLTDGTGRIKPLQAFQFAGIPGAFGIHLSKRSGITGTAAPAYASLRFFVEILDAAGLTYRDPVDNKVKNFILRTITIPNSSGQLVSVKVRSIGSGSSYAGEVYMMKKQPNTNIKYAFGIRSNKTANVANNMWNLVISAMKRDSEKFKSTVRDGLNLWASAMVYPDIKGGQHTAVANNQGRSDLVKPENGAVLNAGTVNPALFPKVGEQPTPSCFDPQVSRLGTSVVSANNGPVGNSCGAQRNWQHVDPAHELYIPWRQQDVLDFFRERNLAEQEITKAELASFVTSTKSSFVQRMNEIAIASTYTFGSQLIGSELTPDDLGLATAVAGAMIGRDGGTRADPFTIILFHMKSALETAIIIGQGVSPTISSYVKAPSNITLQQAIEALDINTARTFVTALNNSIKFVVNKCLFEAGKLNWNELVKIKAFGRTIATGAMGAAFGGFDSMNINGYRFERDASGAPICSIVSETSSPVKYYKIDGESCVQTHGGFVNQYNKLAPGLYDTQAEELGALWAGMNQNTGHGVGAYLCRNIDEGYTKDELLAQFEKDVVATYRVVIR
jgi:hypothetical protein